MFLFKNFIVVVILIGVLTRVGNFIFCKYVDRSVAIYLSAIATGLLIFPFVAYFIGFDILVSEYVLSLIAWFVFDLLRKDVKKRSL
jgi:hypothetical protein